jgi:regulator of sirC expression with transglutaminase-like and TPR domain
MTSDVTERFRALLAGDESGLALDEVALLVAAHADPSVDVDRGVASLDEVASRCADPTFNGVLAHMHDEGFAGNRDDYYDARNSYLNEVLARRTGIPITLSVVMIEIGRRIGVPIVGIGLPGHFVVRDAADPDVFADPFNGVILDRASCRRMVDIVDETVFEPIGSFAIVARLLANLKAIHLARRDRDALARVLELRVEVPGVPCEERRELASVLAAAGRFDDAATQLDRLAEIARGAGDGAMVDEAEGGALRLRARLN